MKLSWQKQLQKSVRSPAQLAEILGRPVDDVFAAKRFPTVVSDSYLARMDLSDTSDPLLLQVLPLIEEDQEEPGYQLDPLAEGAALKGSGLIQKYDGRLLVVCGSACAIHCRYCFRKNFSYESQKFCKEELRTVLRESPDVWEVLLSGGDPLCMPENAFEDLFQFLNEFEQIRSIRIHTRMPIVLPDRVNENLLQLFASKKSEKNLVMVLHANHARELRLDAAEAISKLKPYCDFLLNQSVLLKSVNDSFLLQKDLCLKLLELGVLPYYIHQLDRVIGTHHFEVSESVGVKIIDGLRAVLPGYAVPRYVREVPGQLSKSPIS